MNRPSEQELKAFFAYYQQDTDFTAYGRLLQSKWREKHGYPMGKSQNGTPYGNYIENEFAKKTGCTFLTENIWNIAKLELEKAKISKAFYQETRFISNLLTSQSMCFNIFGEFLNRKELLCKIFNELKPGIMDKLIDIKFEYSPGLGDENYLGDHTAFDVFIEYEKNNEKEFLGIEGKYAEHLREESIEQAERNFKNHRQYAEVTKRSELFKLDAINDVKYPPYSQIWRDHLLSISLKEKDVYKNGYFVYLYPFNNLECRSGIKNYMNYLKNPEKSIFEIYVEDIIKTIRNYLDEDWTKELVERYINGL